MNRNEIAGSIPDTALRRGLGESGVPRLWEKPRLVRLGSVAQVTAKVDNVGNNDGGTGQMKRT